MDPVKETSEDEDNLRRGIRQSILAMNLIGGIPKAGESSSTVPTMELPTKSRRSSMATLLTRGKKSTSSSSGSDQEPASRRPSLASIFGGNGGQSAQQPSSAPTTEEQEEEQEDTLKRRKSGPGTHLRFRQPLTTANPREEESCHRPESARSTAFRKP